MKKNLFKIFTLFYLISGTPVMAQHELVVELENGSTQSFVLSKKPVVTFSGSKLLIEVPEEVSLEKELSEVKGFHFGLIDENAIEGVAENEIRFARIGSNVQIFGLENSDMSISVFDMEGRQATATVRKNGSQADVILDRLPKGYYIIKVGNVQSIKVYKK